MPAHGPARRTHARVARAGMKVAAGRGPTGPRVGAWMRRRTAEQALRSRMRGDVPPRFLRRCRIAARRPTYAVSPAQAAPRAPLPLWERGWGEGASCCRSPRPLIRPSATFSHKGRRKARPNSCSASLDRCRHAGFPDDFSATPRMRPRRFASGISGVCFASGCVSARVQIRRVAARLQHRDHPRMQAAPCGAMLVARVRLDVQGGQRLAILGSLRLATARGAPGVQATVRGRGCPERRGGLAALRVVRHVNAADTHGSVLRDHGLASAPGRIVTILRSAYRCQLVCARGQRGNVG
jgi:hypothetical protein